MTWSTEAIATTIGLLVSLPAAVAVLWKCARSRRKHAAAAQSSPSSPLCPPSPLGHQRYPYQFAIVLEEGDLSRVTIASQRELFVPAPRLWEVQA